MFKRIVNEFRQKNGRNEVGSWNDEVEYFCQQHCWAMTRAGNIYHAEPHLLGEWQEAVAICMYNGQPMWDILSYVTYDVLGHSDGHKDLILNCNEMACAYAIDRYRLFVTLRGK